MSFDLTGKNIVVTGATRGIGRSVATYFAELGARVIINSRNLSDLKNTQKEMKAFGLVVADVTKEEEAKSLIVEAENLFGDKIDGLVCNVGSGRSVAAGCETNEEWKRVFDVNFFSATNCVDFAKEGALRSGASVVLISSICGIECIPGAPITYGVAKSALNFYVKSMSRVLSSKSIRINAIAPGNILFPDSVWDLKIKENRLSVEKMLESDVPLKRLGTVDDIKELSLYLASEKSSFMTGNILTIDGGQTRS